MGARVLISSLSVIGVEHATTRWPQFIGSPSRCVGRHVEIDTAFPRRIVRVVTYDVDAAEPTRMSKDQADSLIAVHLRSPASSSAGGLVTM
jgi:hypothetical protein